MSAGEARRVCLLTGASGRLGSYFANLYADRYDFVAVYRNTRPWMAAQDASFFDPLAPQESVTEISENGRRVYAVQEDLTTPGACDRVVELAIGHFDRIDLVVNAAVASVWSPMLGSDHLTRSAPAQLATNILVPLELSQAVARRFWQDRQEENRRWNRNVVNVSSIAGLRVFPGSGQSLYAATKAALNLLTGHMAQEFATIGIRVNATAANSFPALVSTERAARAIRDLDEGDASGTIVVVDADHDEVLEVPVQSP